jgi:exosortase
MGTAAASGEAKALAPAPKRVPYAWVTLAVAVALVYWRVLWDWALDMWGKDDYSHGILLPFALAYLIHQKRDYLQQLPLRQSWFGLLLVAGSQFVNLVGFLGAEFFLQRISLVFFLAGLILFVYGWRHLWESAFALVLIVLAIPLPTIVFNAIAFPLQLIASSVAENFLQALNIPVLREGNILTIPNMTLSVAEACSGIRSLMSLITLGVMVAYFLPFRWWLRGVFILSTIPIAVVTNAFRVGGTGVLAHHYGPAAAEGFFHSFSGWLVFVSAFGLLLLEVSLLMKLKIARTQEKGNLA